jgi:thiamine pyrophosphokinase
MTRNPRKSAVLLGASEGGVRTTQLSAQFEAAGLSSVQWMDAQSPLRVGVDGGVASWRSLKLVPELAVGDWDSLDDPEQALQDVPHRVNLSVKKDQSDLRAALEETLRFGVEDWLCFGVTGGRPDHHLATLQELSLWSERKGAGRVRAWDELAQYVFLSEGSGHFDLRQPKGQVFSVFPMGEEGQISLSGASYSLENFRLLPGSRGLSNRVENDLGTSIQVQQGRVVVVIPSKLA